jgi:acetylornithine deacetylase/succinyl-diaminopimelate desuccinylase-like protein
MHKVLLNAALTCAALVIAACASTADAPRYIVVQGTQAAPEPAPAAPQVAAPAELPPCPRATALDPKQLTEEAACLLAQYVRIDTTNPPGNELAAAEFLQAVLARDGIEAQRLEPAPGRANLVARLPGASAGKAIALSHHMDVVPATASEWSVPPFEAVTRDGYLWGRGSLDNKAGGIIGVLTMAMAKRLGKPLPRELVVLAVADEEAGSGQGTRWLTAQHPEVLQNIEYVLNEGGAIIKAGPGRFAYSIELAQKAPLWLRISARGESGHGSSPSPTAATARLARALGRLADYRFPIVVLPEVQALYAAKAMTLPEPLREGARDLTAALKKPKFRDAFMADAHHAALVQNTLAITMLQGSDKENVIPGEASAVLDMRILPGQDASAVTAEVARVIGDPSIEVKATLSWQAQRSPRDTALFRAIEAHAAAHDPGAPVIANVIGGFTDCNAYRAHGLTCYGFMPTRLSPELFAGIHGKDERVEISGLGPAIIELHALLTSLPAQ